MAGTMKKAGRSLLHSTRNRKGFSLVEVISVLVVLGVLSAVIFSKYMSTASVDSNSQASVVKNAIRYAQSRAIKLGDPDNPNTVWGIKSEGGQYWLFKTVSPDDAASWVTLPSESTQKVTAANHNITITPFIVFFDYLGTPYTSYTTSTVNTRVSAGNPLSVTINATAGGAAVTFNVTPETGFIP